jgi:transposase InsO family protein
MKFSALKFQVRHIRGTKNSVADALSRMLETPSDDVVNQASRSLTLTNFSLAFQELSQLQRQNPELADIMGRVDRGETVGRYLLQRDTLYSTSRSARDKKLVVPTAVIPIVFPYYHDSPLGGHLNVDKTPRKIRQHFTWKGTNKDIFSRVRSCHISSLSKPVQNTKLGVLVSVVSQSPMHKILIHYLGKFRRSRAGNSVILVSVDAFSKFAWMIPVRQATASATIKALKTSICSSYSVPEVLVSDNARCFVSQEFRQFCFELGVKHIIASPFYPQPSHAERFNRNLRAALIAFNSNAQDTCDQELGWLEQAFNTAEHEATKSSPIAIMFPFRSGLPLLNRWKITELLPVKVKESILQRK